MPDGGEYYLGTVHFNNVLLLINQVSAETLITSNNHDTRDPFDM